MTPLEILVLITVLFLPPIACKLGFRRGVAAERARMKECEAIRLRYCRCGIQKPTS